ncbi:hypothetical protein YC2023_109793 [Brassica napus]
MAVECTSNVYIIEYATVIKPCASGWMVARWSSVANQAKFESDYTQISLTRGHRLDLNWRFIHPSFTSVVECNRYYSIYRHVENLAQEIRKLRCWLLLMVSMPNSGRSVPETLQEDLLSKMSAPPKSDAPLVTPNDLAEADGFVFGFPTRFSMMAAQFKVFLDATGGLRRTQQLAGNLAGILYSTRSQGGGQNRVNRLSGKQKLAITAVQNPFICEDRHKSLLPLNEESIFENVSLVVVKMKSGTMKVVNMLLYSGLRFESPTMKIIADYRKSRFQVPEKAPGVDLHRTAQVMQLGVGLHKASSIVGCRIVYENNRNQHHLEF